MRKRNLPCQIEVATQEIVTQALKKSGKEKAQDLNLLEILNSYDQLIATHNLSAEDSTKVYKRILQLSREDLPSARDQAKHVLSVASSLGGGLSQNEIQTLNRKPEFQISDDLRFDFKGSFAGEKASLANKHASSQASQVTFKPSLPKLSLVGSSHQPSMFDDNATLAAPPSVNQLQNLNSNCQSVGTVMIEHSVDASNNPSQPQIQAIESRQQPIKLPKLSFNDCIEAQASENFKKNQKLCFSKDSSEEKDFDTVREVKPEEDNELLKSADLTAFNEGTEDDGSETESLRYSHAFASAFGTAVPSKNISAVSTNQQVMRPALRDVSYHQSREQSSDCMNISKSGTYLTKEQADQEKELEKFLFMNTENEPTESTSRFGQPASQGPTILVDSFLPPASSSNKQKHKYKSKENAIDDYQTISSAFYTRKLALKAYKSFLIYRMKRIHRSYLLRVAKGFQTKKRQREFFNAIKKYNKIVRPLERKEDAADQTYRTQAQRRYFNALRWLTEEKRQQRIKTREFQTILEKRTLRRCFATFDDYRMRQRFLQTQEFTAEHMSKMKMLQRAFGILFTYRKAKRGQRLLQLKVKLQRESYLETKVFQALLRLVQDKKQALKSERKADEFFEIQHSINLQKTSFFILKSFAEHQRQLREADQLCFLNLSRKVILSFQQNIVFKSKKRATQDFAYAFRTERLKQIAFKAFEKNIQDEAYVAVNHEMYLERKKFRRAFLGWKEIKEHNSIKQAPWNGVFLIACTKWLQVSFSQVMEQVWQEFPAQKEQKVAGLQEAMILPYIHRSRKSGGVRLHTEANHNLAKFYKFRFFYQLYETYQKVKKARTKKENELKREIFSHFVRKIQRQKTLKQLLVLKKQKGKIIVQEEVFRVFKKKWLKNQKVRRIFRNNFVEPQRKQKADVLRKWNLLFRKKQILKGLLKERIESGNLSIMKKMMNIWMVRFLNIEKKKKLEILRGKFETQVTKRNLFFKWLKKAEKQSYLSHQEKHLVSYQQNLTLELVLKAFKKNAEIQQNKKSANEAARQEYLYWLGKRVFQSLRDGIRQSQTQQMLYQQLEYDFRVKTASKCIQQWSFQVTSRKIRAENKALVEVGIANSLKRRFFLTWQREFDKKEGTKRITEAIQRLRVRSAFNSIEKRQEIELRAQTDMIEKRMLLTVIWGFRCFQKNAWKNKFQRQELQKYDDFKRDQGIQKRALKKWAGISQKRMNLYKIYAFTVIQLKNHVLRSTFGPWKARVERKKEAEKRFNECKLTFKSLILQALKEHSMKTQKCYMAYQQVSEKTQRKEALIYLREWHEASKKESLLNKIAEIIEFKKKEKLFRGISTGAKEVNRRSNFQEEKTYQVQAIQTKIIFSMIKKAYSLKLKAKDDKAKAQNFAKYSLAASFFLAWKQDYVDRNQEIKAYLTVSRKQKEKKANEVLQMWLQKCEVPLRKIRCIQKVEKVRRVKHLSKRMIVWKKQTLFLRKLQEKTEEFRDIQGSKDAFKALQKLKSFVEEQKSERSQIEELQIYNKLKLQKRALSSFKEGVMVKKAREQLKEIGRQHYKRRAIVGWFIQLRSMAHQGQMIKQAQNALREKQVAIYCIPAAEKMQRFVEASKVRKVANSSAYQYRNQRLQLSCFKALLDSMVRQQTKKLQKARAVQVYVLKIFKQSFNAWHTFKEEHQLITNRRKLMTMVIQKADEENLERDVFDALRMNQIIELEQRQEVEEIMLFYKQKRLFNAILKSSWENRDGRAAQEMLKGKVEKREKSEFFSEWFYLWKREMAIKSMARRRKQAMLQGFIGVCMNKVELKRKLDTALENKAKLYEGIVYNVMKERYMKQKLYKQKINEHQFNQFSKVAQKMFKLIKKNIFNQRLLEDFVEARNHQIKRQKFNEFKKRRFLSQTLNEKLSEEAQALKQQALKQWISKFSTRVQIQDSLYSLSMKKQEKDSRQVFKLWKKEAYFEKFCEAVHGNIIVESNANLAKSVIREWRRISSHNMRKEELHEIIENNHYYHMCKNMLQAWRQAPNIQARSFQNKITRIFKQNDCDFAFTKMVEYDQDEKRLNTVAQGIARRQKYAQARYFLDRWFYAFNNKQVMKTAVYQREIQTKQSVFQAIYEHKLQRLEEKYQVVRIINFFGDRRPELLLVFSKVFLSVSHQYSDRLAETIDLEQECFKFSQHEALTTENNEESLEVDLNNTQQVQKARMCNKALMQYVLQKWKNVKQVLQVENQLEETADEFYCAGLIRKTFSGFSQGVLLRKKIQVLKESCYEFYVHRLGQKVFQALRTYKQVRDIKNTLEERYEIFQEERCRGIFQGYFTYWRIEAENKIQRKLIGQQIEQKRENQLAYQTLMAMRENARFQRLRKRDEKKGNEKAFHFRFFQLTQKSIKILQIHSKENKLDKQKNALLNKRADCHFANRTLTKVYKAMRTQAYILAEKNKRSKMYSILVAWKFYTKEKTLLKKYLNECNYFTEETQQNMPNKENRQPFINSARSGSSLSKDSVHQIAANPFIRSFAKDSQQFNSQPSKSAVRTNPQKTVHLIKCYEQEEEEEKENYDSIETDKYQPEQSYHGGRPSSQKPMKHQEVTAKEPEYFRGSLAQQLFGSQGKEQGKGQRITFGDKKNVMSQ